MKFSGYEIIYNRNNGQVKLYSKSGLVDQCESHDVFQLVLEYVEDAEIAYSHTAGHYAHYKVMEQA